MNEQQYYTSLAAAYVRGYARRETVPGLPAEYLDAMTDEEVIAAGKAAELKMYRFKNSHEELPRVRKVLGFLKGQQFESLLDVGSGRGAFLFPFWTHFPG